MLARERTAWVWLAALIVVFGVYFSTVSLLEPSGAELTFLARIGLLAGALGTLALIVGIDRAIGWMRNRDKTPTDERDRLIEARSSAIAYYVLMVGMIVVGCVMPFSADTWQIVHAALLSIVVAEVVHHGLVVLGYRVGWHVG